MRPAGTGQGVLRLESLVWRFGRPHHSCRARPSCAPQEMTCARLYGYSTTSSARASSMGGTVRPSAFAVLRLITSSYLVGACTWQVGRFRALEDAINVTGGKPVLFYEIGPIGDQTTGGNEVAVIINCRQLVPGRQRDDLTAKSGCQTLDVRIRPPFPELAKVEMVRSTSSELRILTGITSTLSDGARARTH